MCFVCVIVVGTGTGTSRRVAMRFVWWCITNRLRLRASAGSTCSSGMTTTATPRTTSSVNTSQVPLHTNPIILSLWKCSNTDDFDLYSSQRIRWNLRLLPTPLKQVKCAQYECWNSDIAHELVKILDTPSVTSLIVEWDSLTIKDAFHYRSLPFNCAAVESKWVQVDWTKIPTINSYSKAHLRIIQSACLLSLSSF